MELRQLETFVAVAEEQGFSRAGDRLHVVQSAVSATIRALERDLGARLFERSAHRVELTDAGRVFLPAARRTLAEAAAARDAIDELRGGLRGIVRLGFFQAQRRPQVSVARILSTFAADHPCVEVKLRGGTSLAHADDLRARRLDLALVILSPGAVPGLEWDVLHSDDSQLMVPADHPLAASSSVELGQLAGERFVDGPPGHALRVENDRAFALANTSRTVAYEVSDYDTIIEFIHYGAAVAILPPWVVIPADAVAAIPIRHHAPHFTTSIARAADHELGAAARALLDTACRLAR
jgi:DNA-binding transcriptional LysR family regulator